MQVLLFDIKGDFLEWQGHIATRVDMISKTFYLNFGIFRMMLSKGISKHTKSLINVGMERQKEVTLATLYLGD